MVLVLVAVVVVATLAVVVFLRLRPRGGDLDSVRSYHSALGTLEHLGDRPTPSSVRVTGPAARVTESPVKPRIDPAGVASSRLPPVPEGDDGPPPDPGAPLVFDDARPADSPRPQPLHVGAGPTRVDRAQRHALESMNHRPRRGTAVLAAVVVLALFGLLAYSGSRRSTSGHHGAATSTTAVSDAHPIRSLSPAASGSHQAKAGGKEKSSTPAAPTSIVAVSSSSASATYPVTTTSYQLSLAAIGPCWVLARSAATGATLWTGTLKAGQRQVIPATGRVTVEMGALGVALAVDKVPVVLPHAMQTPFVATFQPVPTAGASGPTGSSTSASGSGGFPSPTSSSTSSFGSSPTTTSGVGSNG